MIRRWFLGLLTLVFLATFALAAGLHFEPEKDELHFLSSAKAFEGRFGLEALRSYPELVTPLALVIWGEIHALTGDALYFGRLLNLVLTFAMACLVAFCAPRDWPRGALAAVGLLLFPYTLPLGVHLYTDALAILLTMAGTIALFRSRFVLAFCAFSCAIATRQYMVQIPIALAASEALLWLSGRRDRWKAVVACGASTATVLAWIAFFGGLANPVGIDDWIRWYPAPMMSASAFILHQGLYTLMGVGAYFVVVEAVLFRRLPIPREMLNWRGTLLALGLIGLFWLDPPLLSFDHPGGPIGRTTRAALPPPDYDGVRVAIYCALAVLGLLRFAGRFDAGFWVVAAGVVLAMKQQIPWEKYHYPTIAVLWTLVSLGQLAGYRAGGARSEVDENALTKQAVPRSGFH
jgi:hypothetical protein